VIPTAGLHPVTREGLHLLERAAKENGLRFTVTSGYRSISKQWTLYNRWKLGSPLQRRPVAIPGTSTHNYGLAFDAVAVPYSRQGELVALARDLGFIWAGPRDDVHFQVVPQAIWSQALKLSPQNPLQVLA